MLAQKKGTRRFPLNLECHALIHGWNRRSGKKRFHSIRIPAVAVNQMAATTGAAVRNLFIVEGAMVEVV